MCERVGRAGVACLPGGENNVWRRVSINVSKLRTIIALLPRYLLLKLAPEERHCLRRWQRRRGRRKKVLREKSERKGGCKEEQKIGMENPQEKIARTT